MRKRVLINEVKSGMVLAEAVLSAQNSILLDQGVRLTEEFISQLKKRNVRTVYVEHFEQKKIVTKAFVNIREQEIPSKRAEEMFQSTPVKRPIIANPAMLKNMDYESSFNIGRSAPPVYFQTTGNTNFSDDSILSSVNEFSGRISYVYEELFKERGVSRNIFTDISNQIVEYVKTDPKKMLEYTRISTLENYVLGHTVNVAVLAVIMGTLKKWDEHKLAQLCVSSLFHDFGMVKVENLIWNQRRKLTDDEKFMIRKHPVYGIDSLQKHTDFSADICFPAYYHHECMDGSGYPKGKRGNLIDQFSRIIGFVDYYSALVGRRVWREAVTPKEAFSIMLSNQEKFDPDLVNLWQSFLAETVDSSIAHLKAIPEQNILIVDCDMNSVKSMKTALSSKGHNVETALTAEEALRRMEEKDPDLIIMDIDLADVRGFETVGIFRNYMVQKSSKNVPIVIATRYCDYESILKARKLGVSEYIAKPFNPSIFVQKINLAVARARKKLPLNK